ncbi:sugar-binding transcriptional regulator [Paenibacillus sp. N1-5-1-14]|uniref:sugar-binding transcriptional regulator n=1 Tax=Paenibacillus radicibacter TaxID=2972488 RepID=UPI002158BB23|nr:sugar-binding transcriptional regulator [Paenibacillus radicibacter]MCR8644681.1 sugar-binding transcriptional regulator [Paenibacillus radicibacter]
MIEAAKLYYLYDYSQQDIASKLGVSRPTVSRLLQQAKEEGIVEIRITDPTENNRLLEQELEQAFGLKKALVAAVPVYEDDVIKTHIGQLTADYLNELVQDGDLIGTSWGTTLYQVALHLEKRHVNNVRIVQLKGGVSHSETKTYATETVQLFEQAFDAKSYQLPLPAIVDHVVVKQAIEQDRHIRSLLELGKEANIALFTIGVPKTDSLLFQVGYLTEEEERYMMEHAVGDIASRFYDHEGNICNESLNARTIGIELHELGKKDQSILIAGGAKKVAGIRGALRAKYANVLVTDSYTARMLLQYEAVE